MKYQDKLATWRTSENKIRKISSSTMDENK